MAKKEVPENVEETEVVEETQSLEEVLQDQKQETETIEEPQVEKSEEEGFKGRFSQFKAKDTDEYLKKLEDAYHHSSSEGVRLSKELTDKEKEMEIISKIVQSDPNLREAFQDRLYGPNEEPTTELTPAMVESIVQRAIQSTLGNNPALKQMEADRVAKDRTVYESFAKEHPEIESDPKISQEIQVAFGALAQAQASNGQTVDFDKTLRMAWRAVNEDDGGELEGMKKVVMKEQGTSINPSQQSSGVGSKTLTPAEIKIAEKFGLTSEQYLEGKRQEK